MKRNWKLITLNRLTTKIGCKFKKNKTLSDYFEDKIKEQENKPKTRIKRDFDKIIKDFIDLIKSYKEWIHAIFWKD